MVAGMGSREQHAAHQREYDKTEAGRIVRERYRSSAKGRAARSARTSRWKKAHRAAHNAHARVRTALKTGRLTKQPCHCGSIVVEAHHPNGYAGDAALDVVWLCDPHHKEAHRVSV